VLRRLIFLTIITALLTSCVRAMPLGTGSGGDLSTSSILMVTPTLLPTFTPFSPASPVPPSETPNPTAFPTATQSDPINDPASSTPSVSPTSGTPTPLILYTVQNSEYLPAIAKRFGVDITSITSPDPLIPDHIIPPGTLLAIPNKLDDVEMSPSINTIPDSEVVYAPTALDLNVIDYVNNANGYLKDYKEYLQSSAWTTGGQSVQRIATENSLNPRLVLAIVDYESNWVRGQPTNLAQSDYPLGYLDFHYKGLFRQLMWASEILSLGYYGWRNGDLTELKFPDGKTLRIDPRLNAGTVAIQYFFAQTHKYDQWQQIVDPNVGFPKFYQDMFGDPWARAQTIEPMLPPTLKQPDLVLPFEINKTWSYSGGPHPAWETRGALAALDFAPSSSDSGCQPSDTWVVATAPGIVIREDKGLVILDLDRDGQEQTGWVFLYMHIATVGKVALGAQLKVGDHIGHPSCEGGIATGTHVHVARKYNGEWILADGPIPFDLSGWIAHSGSEPYEGTLTNGDQTVTACPCGSFETRIKREANP
jgi:LasA protease